MNWVPTFGQFMGQFDGNLFMLSASVKWGFNHHSPPIIVTKSTKKGEKVDEINDTKRKIDRTKITAMSHIITFMLCSVFLNFIAHNINFKNQKPKCDGIPACDSFC